MGTCEWLLMGSREEGACPAGEKSHEAGMVVEPDVKIVVNEGFAHDTQQEGVLGHRGETQGHTVDGKEADSEGAASETVLYIPDLVPQVPPEGSDRNEEVTVLIQSLAPDGSIQYQPQVVRIINPDTLDVPNFDALISSFTSAQRQEAETTTTPLGGVLPHATQDEAFVPTRVWEGDSAFQGDTWASMTIPNAQDGVSTQRQEESMDCLPGDINFKEAFDIIKADAEDMDTSE
jgi:hypothetical protein